MWKSQPAQQELETQSGVAGEPQPWPEWGMGEERVGSQGSGGEAAAIEKYPNFLSPFPSYRSTQALTLFLSANLSRSVLEMDSGVTFTGGGQRREGGVRERTRTLAIMRGYYWHPNTTLTMVLGYHF